MLLDGAQPPSQLARNAGTPIAAAALAPPDRKEWPRYAKPLGGTTLTHASASLTHVDMSDVVGGFSRSGNNRRHFDAAIALTRGNSEDDIVKSRPSKKCTWAMNL